MSLLNLPKVQVEIIMDLNGTWTRIATVQVSDWPEARAFALALFRRQYAGGCKNVHCMHEIGCYAYAIDSPWIGREEIYLYRDWAVDHHGPLVITTEIHPRDFLPEVSIYHRD